MAAAALFPIDLVEWQNWRVRLGSWALGRFHAREEAAQQRTDGRGPGIYRARPWLIFARLLSGYDVVRAVISSRMRTWVDTFFAVLGICSIFVSPIAGWSALSIFIGCSAYSVISFGLNLHALHVEDSQFVIIDMPGDHQRLTKLVRGVPTDQLLRYRNDRALYLTHVNDELFRQSRPGTASRTAVTLSSSSTPLPPAIEEFKRQILLNRYQHSRQSCPFNGQTVRQASDLAGFSTNGDQVIRLERSHYFDLMCTNYLTESYMTDHRPGGHTIDGLDLLRDAQGNLQDLDASRLANAVGVSTLAFDSDGNLILIQQSQFAQSSRNRWAPSGSGSLEPIDVIRSQEGKSPTTALVDVIRRGMNRELLEEANLRESHIHDSRLLAYFRWLNKGGKPEYVGVTRLNAVIGPRQRRMTEHRWVMGVTVGVPVDFDLLERSPRRAHQCLGERNQRDEFAMRMSFPLYVGLYALGQRLGKDQTFKAWLRAPMPAQTTSRFR